MPVSYTHLDVYKRQDNRIAYNDWQVFVFMAHGAASNCDSNCYLVRAKVKEKIPKVQKPNQIRIKKWDTKKSLKVRCCQQFQESLRNRFPNIYIDGEVADFGQACKHMISTPVCSLSCRTLSLFWTKYIYYYINFDIRFFFNYE